MAHTAVHRAAGRLRYHPLASREDLDVHLVVPKCWHEFGRTLHADPADDPGVTLHILPVWFDRGGPFKWYLHLYPALSRLVKELAPDVVHLWEEPWSLVALHASHLKRDAALVLEVDQNLFKRLPPPFEWIRHHVLARTDHVLSRSTDATAVARASGYAGPVTEIGYGVDTATFHPQAAVTGLKGDVPKVGYVGRLVVEKGLDDLLDAVARSSARIEVALMGEGPHGPALRRRVAELGLADRVDFRPWGTPTSVADFMRGLDALVLLTRTTNDVKEQFGRVIIEAQACGVPVIGSTCGAIPLVVGSGGWIVPESDPDALARRLEAIAADPSTLATTSTAALANVADRFTQQVVARTLTSAWEDAADRRRRIPR